MMKGLGKLLAWLLALLLGCVAASAHEDTMLELRGGKLVTAHDEIEAYRVPEKYLPMEYDVATHRVRIGKREMTLIPFLAGLFPEDGKYKVSFSASWYHDLELSPPYLQIRIEPEGRQFRFDLILNMKELDVIKLQVTLDLGNGGSQFMTIDLSQWREEIEKSIKPVEEK